MNRELDFDKKSLSNYSRATKQSKTSQRSDGQKIKLLNHLDLKHFKTQHCTNSNHHNQKHCFYFHNNKDRRRPGDFYSTDMCDKVSKKGGCPIGDKCLKSHNRVEQLFRQEKYKTKFCSNYPGKLKKCDFGPYCCFSHSEEDVSVDLIHNYVYDEDFYMFHYKTVWCPFNLNYHDKSLCVYAHNWQDFRRKPSTFEYEPISCKHWKISDYIINYEKGCINGYNCKGCHGWKEMEYHPLMYKTKPCPSGENCPKRRDCSNYHNFSERREISTLQQLKITKLVPRNRIVSGTFKEKEVSPQRRVSISDSFYSSCTKNNKLFRSLIFINLDSDTYSTASIDFHLAESQPSMKSIHFGDKNKKRNSIIESSQETLVSRNSFADRRNSVGGENLKPSISNNKPFMRRAGKRKTTIKEDAEFLLELMSDSDSKSSLSLHKEESEENEVDIQDLL